MNYVALSGQSLVGKTTLAQALEQRGYLLVNFTDILKERLAYVLTALGCPTSVEDIKDRKPLYRTLLQSLGRVVGFDRDPRFVQEALEQWVHSGYPRAVFDNVRTFEQYAVLRSCGFHVVRLEAPIGTLLERAARQGLSAQEYLAHLEHPVEHDEQLAASAALILDATRPVDELAEEVMHGLLGRVDPLSQQGGGSYGILPGNRISKGTVSAKVAMLEGGLLWRIEWYTWKNSVRRRVVGVPPTTVFVRPSRPIQ
jgi:dephospho-CoA kinase